MQNLLTSTYNPTLSLYIIKDRTGNTYKFQNVIDVKIFIDYYYAAPIAAIFVYELMKAKGQAL